MLRSRWFSSVVRQRKIRHDHSNHDFFYGKILPALAHFQKLHGHLLVPVKFIIPHNDSHWPELFADLKLGYLVDRLRVEYRRNGSKGEITPTQINELNDLKFAWNKYDYKFENFFLHGVRLFKQIHAHADIPNSYIVPESDSWPKYLHGYKIGSLVKNIRSVGQFEKHMALHRVELQELGFPFNVFEFRWNTFLLPALQYYYKLHRNTHIPYSYTVPVGGDNNEWDRKLHGLSLGYHVARVRSGRYYREFVKKDADLLAAINFNSTTDDIFYKSIVPALEAYRTKYKNDESMKYISYEFIVPDGDEWPKACRGLNLGEFVNKIVNEGLYWNDVKQRHLIMKHGIYRSVQWCIPIRKYEV